MASRNPDPGEVRRRFTDDVSEFSTVLGAGVTAEGTLSGTTNVEVKGRFEGELRVEGTVWLRPGARFKGSLQATRLIVEGELEGTVMATDKVDLRATSRVQADITAGLIAAAEGSFFQGKIAMTGERSQVLTYREKRGGPA